MPCEPLILGRGYTASVNAALSSKVDVWGNRLLGRPEGPTYENVKGFLKPLMFVGRPAGRRGARLTDSGVYYVPMGEPGGRSFADAGPTEPGIKISSEATTTASWQGVPWGRCRRLFASDRTPHPRLRKGVGTVNL